MDATGLRPEDRRGIGDYKRGNGAIRNVFATTSRRQKCRLIHSRIQVVGIIGPTAALVKVLVKIRVGIVVVGCEALLKRTRDFVGKRWAFFNGQTDNACYELYDEYQDHRDAIGDEQPVVVGLHGKCAHHSGNQQKQTEDYADYRAGLDLKTTDARVEVLLVDGRLDHRTADEHYDAGQQYDPVRRVQADLQDFV
jgi:hypothetical protein